MKIGELTTNENDNQDIELYFWNTALFIFGVTIIGYALVLVVFFFIGMILGGMALGL